MVFRLHLIHVLQFCYFCYLQGLHSIQDSVSDLASSVYDSKRPKQKGLNTSYLLKRDTRILHPEPLSSPHYPEYRFLSQSRIPCPNHWRIRLPRVAVLSRIPLMFPARTEIPRSVFWSNPGIPEIPFQTLLKRKKGKATIFNVETVISLINLRSTECTSLVL